ncbi:MAG TPA: hypothetical protein VMU28_09685 [Terriglobales bacterium]|nr:hypothetical protein [Terriglobales bacterium]
MLGWGTERGADHQLERLEKLIHSRVEEEICAAAENPHLNEDLAKALLVRRDLPVRALERLAKNPAILKSRPVLVALVAHPKTPRFVSLPLARSLYTFELMAVALQPAVPADVKIAIEQLIVDRLEKLSLGERITLAKRGSARVAERLLIDEDLRVVELALNNPYLTEAAIIRTLMRDPLEPRFVERVARHSKWSLRTDVRCALLRNPNTPMAAALQFAQTLPADIARDALYNSNLPHSVKTYLMAEIQNRLRE